MNTTSINIKLVEGYFQLLKNLSPANKLDLISRLTASVKADFAENEHPTKSTFRMASEVFQLDQDVEEFAREVRESRTFTREIEEF